MKALLTLTFGLMIVSNLAFGAQISTIDGKHAVSSFSLQLDEDAEWAAEGACSLCIQNHRQMMCPLATEICDQLGPVGICAEGITNAAVVRSRRAA